MIDLYCERLGPGLWAEPLNALTNAAFVAAAIGAAIQAMKHKQFDAYSMALCGLVFLIGIGSAAFHTLATYPAMLADTIPILIFQLVFLVAYTRRGLGWSFGRTFFLLVLYLAAAAAFGALPQAWLNGSASYLPALLFMGALASLPARRGAQRSLFSAMALFLVSLTFRSVDNAVCADIPVGTHFLWHLCNAGVLYLTIRAYHAAALTR